jgi:hypothetical protein
MSDFFLIPSVFGYWVIWLDEIFVRQVCFAGFLLVVLRSSFALPSLQSRDNNIGFRETGVKQTCLFAAFEAGYSGADRANFMRE